MPLLFLHETYQPEVSTTVGSTGVTVRLTDLAVLAVLAAALATARRQRAVLRAGRVVWAAIAAFVALTLLACVYPLLVRSGYPWQASLVTAVKFAEYALLAPAAAVLLARRDDVVALLTGLVCWSAAMTTVGVLQFLGLVNEFEGRRPGQREPSYVGIHDFAALSAAALVVGLVVLALGGGDRFRRVGGGLAILAGGIGLVLSASVAGAAGIVAAAAAALVVSYRSRSLDALRGASICGVTAAVVLGVLALRGSDIGQFLRFVGIRPADTATGTHVQSYSQRTLLSYIGFRIFLDHPLVGAGYQASVKDEAVYGRYLADAHRRFPDVSAQAFPSPEHPWGVQNFYIQALADMGVLGLALWLAVLGSGLALAARRILRGPPDFALVAAGWLLVVGAIWTAQGIIAGLPLDALTFLALGLAVREAAPRA